jgi:phosphoglycolate phosphatase-like HAD superfamily hydrolase
MRGTNGFRWTEADAFLFDIDGTLLVSKDRVHFDALNHAMLEVYGEDTTIAGIAYHGKTDLGILRAALSRAGVSSSQFEDRLPAALDAICREVSSKAGQLAPQVCPAVPEVLARLRSLGKLLGVASGNLAAVGWHKIEAARLRDFFSFGCFSDHLEARGDVFAEGVREARRRLDKHAKVCFFGDTPEDVKAARFAGAQIIAVGTGIFPAEELALHNPDLCISSCAELFVGEPAAHLL